MKVSSRVLVFLALTCSSSLAAAETLTAKVTPVEKVLQMLNGMVAKGEQEKHEEQVQFAAYKQFCDDTSTEKTRSIKEEAMEEIEMLKADIQKATADAAQLSKEIAGHDSDIAAWSGNIKAATEVRAAEKADFDTLNADYSESIDALERATMVLKKQAYDRKQSGANVGTYGKLEEASFAQLQTSSLVPPEAKKAITAFLQQDPEEPADELAVTAPEANAYEFQSNHIIEILEKLHDKFMTERTELQKSEASAQHNYDMLKQDMEASIAQGTTDRTEKTESKAQTLQQKADDEGTLTDTTTTMEDDQKYLAELTATCEQKATDFESRQQLRTEELEAIRKAIEIISSESVKGHAETYLPSLLQQKKQTMLGQLRDASRNGALQARAASYLRSRAQALNSRVLSALSVRASDDPFEKVKKMIKDLIVRLMEEANEEAEHKGWCDTELATNEQTRKEKTAAVEKLHAEIDELEASIAKLAEDITQLTEDVAALEKAMAEATTLRQEEKANNTQTIADAKEAQTAVAAALTVLKEFYAKAGEATALMQQQPVAPEIFDSPYKGMQSENGGVIGMLEVIQSDFARLESDTAAAEAAAQKAYDEFMTTSEVDKAQKTKDIEHKTAKKQDHEQMLIVKKEDLEGTQKELDAALAYYDKLKPSCVDAGVSYDDRVSRRKEEIESLQEALRILNGEELA
ncbi:putative conserved tandem protein 12 [Amphidinium carterae]